MRERIRPGNDGLLRTAFVVIVGYLLLGATLLLARKKPKLPLECSNGSSFEFLNHSMTAFNHLYCDPTSCHCHSCHSPSDRLSTLEPSVLQSFSHFQETRLSYDATTGKQVASIENIDQPGIGQPELSIYEPHFIDREGKERSFDPGVGDETFIKGKFEGKPGEVCTTYVQRKCKQ